tara:strand:- start:7 stop:387 length:381 start_codon:yes stop_codon:yes gene_type:complete
MAKDKSTQVFYPKYALFIVMYACIFVSIGVFFAKIIDSVFPKFDEKETPKKNKMIIYLEVLSQISAIAIATYIFREYVHFFIQSIDYFKKHSYGSPDKFAALIIAPTMFSVQPSLINKIKFLANSI